MSHSYPTKTCLTAPSAPASSSTSHSSQTLETTPSCSSPSISTQCSSPHSLPQFGSLEAAAPPTSQAPLRSDSQTHAVYRNKRNSMPHLAQCKLSFLKKSRYSQP